MKYLENLPQWKAFKESDYPYDNVKEPTEFPCYAYERVISYGMEESEPVYLYAKDLYGMLKAIGDSNKKPSPRKNKEWPKWFTVPSNGWVRRYISENDRGIYFDIEAPDGAKSCYTLKDLTSLEGFSIHQITSRQAAAIRRGWKTK